MPNLEAARNRRWALRRVKPPRVFLFQKLGKFQTLSQAPSTIENQYRAWFKNRVEKSETSSNPFWALWYGVLRYGEAPASAGLLR